MLPTRCISKTSHDEKTPLSGHLLFQAFGLDILVCRCSGAIQPKYCTVYLYNEAGECNGSQLLPTVRLSTRLGSENATVPAKTKYTGWVPVSDNCRAAQNVTLSLPTIFNEILSTGIANPQYQFRIELSPANPCHCLNVDNATGVTGNNIFSGWRNGRLWCSNNITQLCASDSDNVTFYSALIRQNGLLSDMAVPLCDNSTDETLGIQPNVSVMQSCSSEETSTFLIPVLSNTKRCAAENDVWKETPQCSVTRASDTESCSFVDANATRVCHCNGEWGQVHCRPSLQLVQELLQASLAEETLIVLSQLLPNATNITQRLDLLVRAVREQLNSTLGITETFVQSVLNIVEDTPIEVDVPDSSFLSILDMVALNLRLNRTVTSQADTIRARVREVFPGSGRVLGIQVGNNYITLPGEIFEDLTKSAFVASFYFENISHLLPVRTQEPISPVISSTLDCSECKTSNLSKNVTVFFDFPPRTTNNRTKCVFADLERGVGPEFWSESGCRTIHFENGSVMCSCNHLSHFAILLSPDQKQILKIVAQVLMSISLVFLLATILTFVLQKSLWTMSNYIHCMLCGSMFTAQLVFIMGVVGTENKAVCSTIAVLVHYLFLVMFMWMLMEGVVLYMKLVRVFITNYKRYIAFFTIASYGVPLLYMVVVVPLGFLVNTEDGYHYGLHTAANGQIQECSLRGYFIWAYIAPVILIILVNVGFLIMALVIMYRHLKKKSKRYTAKHWLKVILSLVIVMGITWISNIIIITFDSDNPVVPYIMIVFFACQGVIIFILLVPLSKQVRDAYIKWWREMWSHSQSSSNGHLPAAKNTTPTNSKVHENKV